MVHMFNSPSNSPAHIDLFGLSIDALTFDEAIESLCACIGQRPSRVVVTPNVDHVISLHDNHVLKQTYATAEFQFADGMPLVWASRLLGKPLPARVTGADLFVKLCKIATSQHWHVAVIGGMPGQEAELIRLFSRNFPNLRLSLHSPPLGFDHEGSSGKTAANWVNAIAPDLVFVCLGFPRQELWAFQERPTLNTSLIFGVGASMEFALGLASRAPYWMQRCGMEWVWRLLSNPRKLWRRYLVRGPRFLKIIWQEWLKHR